MMKDCEEEEGGIERYRQREGVSERETGRQREREGQKERGPRERERGEGEGLKGPQASSNLWHGKKEELALCVSVCAYTPQRKTGGLSAALFCLSQHSVTLQSQRGWRGRSTQDCLCTPAIIRAET